MLKDIYERFPDEYIGWLLPRQNKGVQYERFEATVARKDGFKHINRGRVDYISRTTGYVDMQPWVKCVLNLRGKVTVDTGVHVFKRFVVVQFHQWEHKTIWRCDWRPVSAEKPWGPLESFSELDNA